MSTSDRTGRTPDTASPTKALDSRIVTAVRDRGEHHVLELAREMGEHPVTVERVCQRLHRDGTLVSVSVGVFRYRDDTDSH